MQLFIPTIGTKLKLLKPWYFTLHNEWRNTSYIDAKGFNHYLSNLINAKKAAYEKFYEDNQDVMFGPVEPILNNSMWYMIPKGYHLDTPLKKQRRILDQVLYDQWQALRQEMYKTVNITTFLDAGTILRVDRIYIRKGIGEYDSLTFCIDDCPDKELVTKKKGGTAARQIRFWARLDNVNTMDCTIV